MATIRFNILTGRLEIQTGVSKHVNERKRPESGFEELSEMPEEKKNRGDEKQRNQVDQDTDRVYVHIIVNCMIIGGKSKKSIADIFRQKEEKDKTVQQTVNRLPGEGRYPE